MSTVDSLQLPATWQTDIASAIAGRDFRLKVARPLAPPPPAGYPCLMVLDGDAYFGFAMDIARNLSEIGAEIAAPVVIGIGYPDADPCAWHVRRAKDLTPTPPGPGDSSPASLTAEHYGGLTEFLDMIEREALPLLQRQLPLDANRRVLFGHSFGGLAVLHALFTKPALFSGHIAISPAIYWNDHHVLNAEPAFVRAIRDGVASPRMFVGVGGLEEVARPATRTTKEHEAMLQAAVRHARMIENAEALARRLQAVSRPGSVRYRCLAGESHVSAPYAAMAEALRFVLPGVASLQDDADV